MTDWAMGERDWARAVASELGLRGYLMGGFASRMVSAALAADSGNLSRIGQGFPYLVGVLSDYRRYGGEYLLALALGDDDAIIAAYESWAEREEGRTPCGA